MTPPKKTDPEDDMDLSGSPTFQSARGAPDEAQAIDNRTASEILDHSDGPFETPPHINDEGDLFPDLDLGDFELDTLYGDVRDALLTRFRQAPHPWPRMSEQEQRETVEAFGITARHIIRKVVQAVTDHDFPRCVVTLGDMKIIGGEKTRIEMKITAPNYEVYRNVLGDHVGSMATIVMVDSEDFMGARREPQIDKDQPDLPLEGQAQDVTPPEEAEEPEAEGADDDGDRVPQAAE